jgi:hypothetical protein
MEEIMVDELKSTAATQDTTPEKVESQDNTAEKQDKTFTQVEVDRLIDARFKRNKLEQPSPEKLEAFDEWQKSQQSEAEKAEERAQELAQAKAEAVNLKRENAVIRAGVHTEDADYVLFKVGRMEGDFAENLAVYLKENEKYTQPETKVVNGVKHTQSHTDPVDSIVQAVRKAAGLS